MLIISDPYLTGHPFRSLLHVPAFPPVERYWTLSNMKYMVTCSYLKEQVGVHLCNLSSLSSYSADRVGFFFSPRLSCFFMPNGKFSYSWPFEPFRQDVFSEVNAFLFLSTWQTWVLVINVFYRNSFRSSGYYCSWGGKKACFLLIFFCTAQFCVFH